MGADNDKLWREIARFAMQERWWRDASGKWHEVQDMPLEHRVNTVKWLIDNSTAVYEGYYDVLTRGAELISDPRPRGARFGAS